MAAAAFLFGLASLATATPLTLKWAELTPNEYYSTGCPLNQLSCHNTTVQRDTCCFESPGGLFMQVQLWDTNPRTGPDDVWTIHGLWPDNCDGTWGQFCDPSREYPSIKNVLTDHKRTDLIDYMDKFWLDQAGDNESFWEHEWNKHGTCMSTLKPKCMPHDKKNGTDAVFFFQTAINLYKTLPTYQILEKAGILPSDTKPYTYDQIASAVKKEIGITPAVDCNKNIIFEIDYYFYLRGSVVDGQWEKIDAYATGSCPKTGDLWYLPKNVTGPAVTTTATGTATATTSTSTATPKPELDVYSTDGTYEGCLISKGVWAATPANTCAGYTETDAADGSFTLTSSKGPCSAETGTLVCAAGGQASSFTWTPVNGTKVLTFNGTTTFSSPALAVGQTYQNLAVGEAGPLTFNVVLKA